MTTAHPDWLSQVQTVTVKPEHTQGRSETGAVLAAVADAMDQENEPFKAGEMMGVVIERGVSVVYAMTASTGKSGADIARIATQYGVEECNVGLMSAYVMLQAHFNGIARCVEFVQGK
jgi:hypothetical protein